MIGLQDKAFIAFPPLLIMEIELSKWDSSVNREPYGNTAYISFSLKNCLLDVDKDATFRANIHTQIWAWILEIKAWWRKEGITS